MEEEFCLFQQFPDSILLHIFTFLDSKSLVTAASVCQQWYRVAQDESLWRSLVFCLVGRAVPLARGKESWKSEYKRLTHHCPTEFHQDVFGHTDEIYHVAFSLSGQYLSSVGRDGTCMLWKYGHNTSLIKRCGPFFNSPAFSRFSEFNESETMLLVAGITSYYDTDGNTFAAILSIPDMELLYAVKGEYPNYRGAWLNDTSFLNASHYFDDGTFFKLEAHEVKPNIKGRKISNIRSICEECRLKGKNILITFPCNPRNDFIRVINPKKWGDIEISHDLKKHQYVDELMVTKKSTASEQIHNPPVDNLQPGINSDSDVNMNMHAINITKETEYDIEDDYESEDFEDLVYKQMIQNAKENTLVKEELSACKKCENLPSYRDILREIRERGGQIVLMVHTPRNEDAESTIAFYHVIDGDSPQKKPFKRIDLAGGILGLRLSLDNRYLVYAYREIVDDEDRFISSSYEIEIETCIYDILEGRHVDPVYKGSKATDEDHLSYIFPDLSEDFIANGSEIHVGHLWDRHYGVHLGTSIQHKNSGPRSSGVNAVMFHPKDQEILITVADDQIIKVWKSKNRSKDIPSAKAIDECRCINNDIDESGDVDLDEVDYIYKSDSDEESGTQRKGFCHCLKKSKKR